MTEAELNRLSEAFSRVASHNMCITKQVFCREVLGELFPIRIAEVREKYFLPLSFTCVHKPVNSNFFRFQCIYSACGGTVRGINFKDLVIVLVVITKGKLEEKTRCKK